MINISEPWIDEETERLVSQVLRSGQLASGSFVRAVEASYSELVGVEHAVAVSSGTAALETVFELLLQPGDAILTTPFTFAATINAAIRAGVRVRFVDVDDTFNMDPDQVADRLVQARALVPVHLFGRPCDMSSLSALADEAGVLVIEDAAQATGARVGERSVGSFGVGCFSLYATKNVAAGEGGVVTTDDTSLAERIRMLINQGVSAPYVYQAIGTNRRLTDLQAAVALRQLRILSDLTGRRRANAARLTAGLGGIPGIVTPDASPGHVFHQYTVRITPEARTDRDTVRKHLDARGIATGVYYPKPVYDYPIYRDHPLVEIVPTPRAARMASEVLSLPVHPRLTSDQVDAVIEGMLEVLGD